MKNESFLNLLRDYEWKWYQLPEITFDYISILYYTGPTWLFNMLGLLVVWALTVAYYMREEK